MGGFRNFAPTENLSVWGWLAIQTTSPTAFMNSLVVGSLSSKARCVETGRKSFAINPITKEEIPTSDMIPGCDILIESASTAGIEAACQRVPVVDYFTDIAINRLEASGGSRTWKPCELGVAIETRDIGNLRGVISGLLSGNYIAKKMKKRQEIIFCKPFKRGSVAKTIADTLISFANQ